MLKRMLTIIAALTLLAFLAGCSKAPKTEYESVKESIDKARASETAAYAPEQFKAASDSLNAAMVEMKKQDGKFSLLRKYGKSEKMIASAQQMVEQANTAAMTEKERVRVSDSLMIDEINMLITETSTAIANAPKGKGSRIDLKIMQTDLDASKDALALAESKYKVGSYMIAEEELTAVKSQVLRVKEEIDTAIAKLAKK